MMFLSSITYDSWFVSNNSLSTFKVFEFYIHYEVQCL